MDGSVRRRPVHLYTDHATPDVLRRKRRRRFRGLQALLGLSGQRRLGPARNRRGLAGAGTGGAAYLGLPRGHAVGLLDRQPAELDVLALRRRSVPVDRRRLLSRLLSAALHRHLHRDPRGRRARAMGAPRTRRHDPDARLRRILLVLRDRADGHGRTRPGHAQVRPDPELHCAQLPHAARLRRAADACRDRGDCAAHAGPADDRFLDDVARRHRLGHGQGHRHLPAGRHVGCHLPVLLCSPHRRGARAVARRARRAAGAHRARRRAGPGHALRRDAGFLPGARLRREQLDVEPGDGDDGHHLRADAARDAAPGRAVPRRRAAARAARGGHRRGPLRLAHQERLRRDHDRGRGRAPAVRLAGRGAHFRHAPGRPRRPQPARPLGRGRPRAARRLPGRGRRDARALDRAGRGGGRQRRAAQHARERRQQPAGRPGDRGPRAQFPRRQRAQGARGAAAPARLPRPADAAREPQPVPQPRAARAHARAALAASASP